MEKYRSGNKPIHKFGIRHYTFVSCFTNQQERQQFTAVCRKFNELTKRLMNNPGNRLLEDFWMQTRAELSRREAALNVPDYEDRRLYYYVQ